ncbi:MAG TPA: AAA family ATPase [Pirellulaceae bacterium]|nr:AAA family ATPase [Pirellulaceae bacterium]HMO91356.1 AAA family ATPase [Pirellulaceae bacterium]HMP70252.1 AAA family ATPase [Pirellulaceae bacterium]
MRSIAIINQKGGVGKTTTAVNLAAALADFGQRVWLIDLDPQAHASLHLGLVPDERQPTVYNALTERTPLGTVRHHVSTNLWVTPSHLDLAAAELELANEVGREMILRDLIEQDPAEFDTVIIDCPPSLGVLTLNALTACREVILPLQPHFLALHGVSKLLQTVEIVAKRLNRELRLSGVVFCMCEGTTRLANEVIGDVEAFFNTEREKGSLWSDAAIYETRIRKNVRLAEAPSFGQSIFEYAPNSNGAIDYLALATEVMAGDRIRNPAVGLMGFKNDLSKSSPPISSSSYHTTGSMEQNGIRSAKFMP